MPPTPGQLPTPIMALPGSKTSQRLLCLNNKLPCLAFKAFQDLVPGHFQPIPHTLSKPPTPPHHHYPAHASVFGFLSDYLMNMLSSQCTRGPNSSLKPEGAREEFKLPRNSVGNNPYSSSLCIWQLSCSSTSRDQPFVAKCLARPLWKVPEMPWDLGPADKATLDFRSYHLYCW